MSNLSNLSGVGPEYDFNSGPIKLYGGCVLLIMIMMSSIHYGGRVVAEDLLVACPMCD